VRTVSGVENGLELPAALEGNAYESDAERFPHALRDAIDALEHGSMARAALGDAAVDRYLHYARTEQRLLDEVVTDYEIARMFERG
jgi:glutamine synthetase